MPDLTPQQKVQLDSNIRGMLSKGASQEDIVSYSKDFRNKYDVAIVEPEVKKKIHFSPTHILATILLGWRLPLPCQMAMAFH